MELRSSSNLNIQMFIGFLIGICLGLLVCNIQLRRGGGRIALSECLLHVLTCPWCLIVII